MELAWSYTTMNLEDEPSGLPQDLRGQDHQPAGPLLGAQVPTHPSLLMGADAGSFAFLKL